MVTNTVKSGSEPRSWKIRLLRSFGLAIAASLGALSVNLIANAIQPSVGKHYWLVWLTVGVSIFACVAEAVTRAKRSSNLPPSLKSGHSQLIVHRINTIASGVVERVKGISWISGPSPGVLNYVNGILKRPEIKECRRFHLKLRCIPGRRDVAELMRLHSRIVITGTPGCGKSVLLRKALNNGCERLRKRLTSTQLTPEPLLIPVYVELGYLKPLTVQETISAERSLEEWICHLLGVPRSGSPIDSILALLQEDNVELLLLLDGLNELGDYEKIVVDQLFSFEKALTARNWHDRVKIVATSRVHGFIDKYSPEGYEVVEILPLDPEDIRSELLRAFPRNTDQIEQLYLALNPKDRQVLSNPQNLDYFIAFCRDSLNKNELLVGPPNRGILLRYFVDRRLDRVDKTMRAVCNQLLSDLAYRTCQSRVSFSENEVWIPTDQALRDRLIKVDRDAILDTFLGTGLLVQQGDDLKFSHQAIQEYFAAVEMQHQWKIGEYVHNDLWREPLAIMAGLLDIDRLHDLLRRVRSIPRIYAYILAHVKEPKLEQAFLRERVTTFIKQTEKWALRLWRKLALMAICWALGLPFMFLFIADMDTNSISSFDQTAILLLVLAYIAAGPASFMFWYRFQFRSNLQRLRNRTLLDLTAILRILQARTEMNAVLRGLSRLRRSLPAARHDPRVAFISDAEAVVGSAVNNQSYMTEDQMLENLDDPLVAEEIDPEKLSSKNLARLFEIALHGEDGPAVSQAIQRLRELYIRSSDHRTRVMAVLQQIAIAANRSRRTQKMASNICRNLNTSRGMSRSFFTRVVEALLSLFQLSHRLSSFTGKRQ
jgi:hypothetical protein